MIENLPIPEGPADRAVRRAPAHPGAHHLRGREPGGPVAASSSVCSTSPRSCCPGAGPDDGRRRGAVRSQLAYRCGGTLPRPTLFSDALSGTEFGPASTDVYDTLLSFLMRGQRVLLWLGLILVVAGWFVGRNAFGSAARRTVRDGLETIGGRARGRAGRRSGQWMVANARWLRVAIVVLGGVVLLWGNNISEARLFWSLVFVVVLLMAVQVLVGAGNASRDLGSAPSGRPETPVTPKPRSEPRPRPMCPVEGGREALTTREAEGCRP